MHDHFSDEMSGDGITSSPPHLQTVLCQHVQSLIYFNSLHESLCLQLVLTILSNLERKIVREVVCNLDLPKCEN